MSLETYKSLLDQAGEYLYRIQFYDNGEPFTNRHLLEMVSLAAERNIGSQVSTNFSFAFQEQVYPDIINSGLEHLIVALDGVTPNVYSKYRIGGRFELVESGLRKIVALKRRLRSRSPFIEWQFIVFDHNRHEIDTAKALAKQIGVDRLCLKYDAGGHRKQWRQIDRVRVDAMRHFRLNTCLWLWGALVVDTDGNVSPCCNAARGESLGDLRQTTLRDIWNSDAIKELRRYVRNEGGSQEVDHQHPCENCPHIL
jgi:radical SAM protein with 4Fe4S-binding SPASM domain